MACGGCGGGTRKLRVQRVVRPQVKKKTNTKQVQKYSVQPERAQRTKRPSAIRRQSLVRGDKCPKCRSTIMLVNIAGRERKQCTNVSCKHIIR
jgi:hypothetical protein